jgi:hypothetical protein
MRRTKSTARCLYMVAASSSSSEDDMSLGVDQEEAPAPTRNVASSSAVSQHRGGVPSQQFTCKYEAYWKDNLSM